MHQMPDPFVTSAWCPLALVNQASHVYDYSMPTERKGHWPPAKGSLLA